jgi:acyl carrier protein
MTLIEQARPIFEGILGPLPDYGRETSPFDVERWDSVAHVNLLLEIETAFDVRFKAEDLGKVQSVGAICDAVEEMAAQSKARAAAPSPAQEGKITV